MSETFEEKCARNARVSARYDELMREGKHGHYETLFRVVREEVERAVAAHADSAAERKRYRVSTMSGAEEFDTLEEARAWAMKHSWGSGAVLSEATPSPGDRDSLVLAARKVLPVFLECRDGLVNALNHAKTCYGHYPRDGLGRRVTNAEQELATFDDAISALRRALEE